MKQIYCNRSCRTKSVLLPHAYKATTPEALERMVVNRLKHPLCGPFETNVQAKDWWILSPHGHPYQVHNLCHFVRTHKQLFSPKDIVGCDKHNCLASNQLARLRPNRASSIRSWKGWTWWFVGENRHRKEQHNERREL